MPSTDCKGEKLATKCRNSGASARSCGCLSAAPRRRNGGRLTLYLKTSVKSSDTAFQFAEDHGVGIFYWVDGEFGYALSGTLDKPRLLEIAKAVYGQVNH